MSVHSSGPSKNNPPITGLHILLTYTCNYECDHCFVWGSPKQFGTFTLAQLDDVFKQAKNLETAGLEPIQEVYFEGGEAFLYYPILVEAVGRAKKLGFSVGIVTNGYWATGLEDAWIWLQPLASAGLDRLELSFDLYHDNELESPNTHPALAAARELFLETSTIAVDPPVGDRDPDAAPGLPLAGGGVMYRGRAAEKLTPKVPRRPWNSFTMCPYEDLATPSRVHLDPFGNIHVCQGIVIGNLFEQPLAEIFAQYDPASHPIVAPLLEGGPAKLVEHYALDHDDGYVDACHICFSGRQALRTQFPDELSPDQMYGLSEASAPATVPQGTEPPSSLP